MPPGPLPGGIGVGSIVRRWNGWGDETIQFPLPRGASRYLEEKAGKSSPLPEATLEAVVRQVLPSRLREHSLLVTDPGERARHARGQSLPDWLAVKQGIVGTFPDAVAYPLSQEAVRALVAFARASGAAVIPYGGGTSVVGHINPIKGGRPVLTVDMGRMNRLLWLDPQSRIAAIEAGAAGPDVEAQLRARGFTLGHFPQSFEYSTLGGWIATRSSGQQSLGFGRIEQLFTGGAIETPEGTLSLPDHPASAAGPNLRELVLGSEGRLGLITEAHVRVTPIPEMEVFRAAFFPDWETGIEAVRAAVQEGIPLSMMRLSNPGETETTLALGGHERMARLHKKWLSWRGAGEERCLLLFAISGSARSYRSAKRAALRAFKSAVGLSEGRSIGKRWVDKRFRAPYLRNTLWEMGYAVDTFETAVTWESVMGLAHAMERALQAEAARRGGSAHVFTHLSHVYAQGASLYTTCVFPVAKTYEDTLEIWQAMKATVSETILDLGGTISHQHGTGTVHLPYLEREKGPLGAGAIRALCRQFDPSGMMNPGKLV